MKKWHIKADRSTNTGLLDTLLRIRGITEESEKKSFLNPLDVPLLGPDIFTDIQKAKKRVNDAVKNHEYILVWGDFDADGVTSTALLYKTFKELNANFDFLIPDREEMGHGLNTKAILPYVSKQKLKVLITVDCGISNNKEISLLKGLGVDVIITDHHSAPDILPEAYAILNPKANDSLNASLSVNEIKQVSEMAGVGVAYKFAMALLSDNKNEELKKELLCLACTGTVADVVPLLGENRTIVAQGLKLINSGCHKGISLLFKSNSKENNITSYDIAFILAPRINAAGRLGSPIAAFNLLTEEDENKLKLIIKELDNYNKVRQSLCDKTLEEAHDEILKNSNFKNEKAVVLYNPEWHIGIIGIVASKIAEKYFKPVFLITKDEKNQARCSIRGIKGYNIHQILEANSDLFTNYGGHSLAGGFSFDINSTTVDEVKTSLLKTVDELYDETAVINTLDIDLELNVDEINNDLIEIVSKLEPTGQDNHAPIFVINDCELTFKKPMGKDESHTMFRCKKDNKELNCVWWRHNDLDFSVGQKIDIAFHARLNSFNGEEYVRLDAVDSRGDIKAKSVKIFDHRMKKDILKQISDYLENPPFDILVWAKKAMTKNKLKEYEPIYSKIQDKMTCCKGLMFFDYPATIEDFADILKETKASKIHLLKEDFDDAIDFYIKQIIGMLKYANNNKKGTIDIKTLANLTGLSEKFVQICLEILESINSIEILDVDKIIFINPPVLEKFYKNTMFEVLNEEFAKICSFKKYISSINTNEIENFIIEYI